MNLARAVCLVVAFCLLGGCGTSVRTFSEADASANFAALKTYGWRGAEVDTQPPETASTSPGVTALTLQAIRDRVSVALAARGLRRAEQPDLVVDIRAGTRERLQTTFWARDPFADRRFGRYPVWPLTDRQTVTTVEESLVAIDMFDAETGRAVWSGIGATPAQLTAEDPQTIDDVVNEILRDFPPPPTS